MAVDGEPLSGGTLIFLVLHPNYLQLIGDIEHEGTGMSGEYVC